MLRYLKLGLVFTMINFVLNIVERRSVGEVVVAGALVLVTALLYKMFVRRMMEEHS